MRSQLVLTLIGRDRPGLVEALAAEVTRHGGNWEESRMAQLAGKFAGILRIAVDQARAGDLARGLASLEREGLRVIVEGAEPVPQPAAAAAADSTGRRARLSLVGNDREGIVRDISRALAARKINVEELETSCEAAPMGGGSLFRAEATLHLPPELATDTLRTALEGLADDLMIEITLDLAPGD